MPSSELAVAERAARAGGDVVARAFRDGTVVRNKQSYNLVSDADVQSEETVVDTIRQAFPDHAFLGEESHRADINAEHLWVIDPLDGTNNFAHGIPHFAVSVAYCRGGQPQCGAIWDPQRQDLYTTQLGHGAYCNGQKVHVSDRANLSDVLVGVGFYYDRAAMMEATLAAVADLFRKHIHGIRRFGTASLDLCLVGTGRFGAFFEYTLSPWDFAAGSLFVREAGGAVTTCRGEPLPLIPSSILATNGRLHAAALEIVRTHAPRSES